MPMLGEVGSGHCHRKRSHGQGGRDKACQLLGMPLAFEIVPKCAVVPIKHAITGLVVLHERDAPLVERQVGAPRAFDAEFLAPNPALGLVEIIIKRPVKFGRSEEHTSELQSLMRISYAVFCLKKKKQKKEQLIHNLPPHKKTNKQ